MDAVRFFDDVGDRGSALVSAAVGRVSEALSAAAATDLEEAAVRVGCERLQVALAEVVQRDVDKFELYFVRNLLCRPTPPAKQPPRKKRRAVSTADDEAAADADVAALSAALRRARADRAALDDAALRIGAAIGNGGPPRGAGGADLDGWRAELNALTERCEDHVRHLTTPAPPA